MLRLFGTRGRETVETDGRVADVTLVVTMSSCHWPCEVAKGEGRHLGWLTDAQRDGGLRRFGLRPRGIQTIRCAFVIRRLYQSIRSTIQLSASPCCPWALRYYCGLVGLSGEIVQADQDIRPNISGYVRHPAIYKLNNQSEI